MPSIELKTNFHLSDPKEFALGFSKVRPIFPQFVQRGRKADTNALTLEGNGNNLGET